MSKRDIFDTIDKNQPASTNDKGSGQESGKEATGIFAKSPAATKDAMAKEPVSKEPVSKEPVSKEANDTKTKPDEADDREAKTDPKGAGDVDGVADDTPVKPTVFGSDGYDKNGYDANGYNAEGYNEYGYNTDGYNANGYDKYGYDANGYSADQYDENGYNAEGYNAEGYNEYGYDADGYNANGYDQNGYDADGYSADGHDQYGYDADGYNANGYDQNGYDADGYSADGYDQYGYDADGYSADGHDQYGRPRDEDGDDALPTSPDRNPGLEIPNDDAPEPDDELPGSDPKTELLSESRETHGSGPVGPREHDRLIDSDAETDAFDFPVADHDPDDPGIGVDETSFSEVLVDGAPVTEVASTPGLVPELPTADQVASIDDAFGTGSEFDAAAIDRSTPMHTIDVQPPIQAGTEDPFEIEVFEPVTNTIEFAEFAEVAEIADIAEDDMDLIED